MKKKTNTKTATKTDAAKQAQKGAENSENKQKGELSPQGFTPNKPIGDAGVQGANENGQENKPYVPPTNNFQKAYALEDARVADAQDKPSDQADNITDQKATKTDGTANVNADKSTPTTEAQLGLSEEIRTGIVEQPNLNKTPEERLGLSNPDDRLAEELREAKITGTLGTDGNTDEGDMGTGSKSDEQSQDKLDSDGKDKRTDDGTFPDGSQKAQELKDEKTGFNFNLEEANRHMALAQENLSRIEQLKPKS